MILYFADRAQNIIGLASNSIESKFQFKNDSKDTDVSTGTQTLSLDIYYEKDNREEAEELTYTGNYILRFNSKYSEYEAYTIIDTDLNSEERTINIYAEGAELDLLNDIADAFDNPEDEGLTTGLEWYARDAIKNTGFTLGINESIEEFLLSFDEETVLSRLQNLASIFDMNLYFTYEIEGMKIKARKVNFVIRRGVNNEVTLRMDKEIKNIHVKRSVANLATAIKPIGSVPPGSLGYIQYVDENDKSWYCWIKYADDSTGKNMEDSPSSKKYIGFAWDKESVVKVEDPKYYTWYRIGYKNVYVVRPTNNNSGYPYRETTSSGKTQYMWIKWAESETGTGMSNIPNSKSKYIGTATKRSESSMSNKAEDYTWKKYSGGDTEDLYLVEGYDMSVQGGRTAWIKYSANEDGSNMTNIAAADSIYAGIVLSFNGPTESSNPEDYVWDKLDENNGNPLQNGVWTQFPFHYTGFKETGKSTYTWVRWMDNEHEEFDDKTGRPLICLLYGQTSETPSLDYNEYIWCKSSGGDAENTTLTGYLYDDGNYYTDGDLLISRNAVIEWTNYIAKGGEIIRTINYDIPYQGELLEAALADLKHFEKPEVNYDVELYYHPGNIAIGDRVNIVDREGSLYISARILKMIESDDEDSLSITLGDFLIEESGITDEVQNLANAFRRFRTQHPHYTWIVYASDENGTDISTESGDLAWMGILENQLTSTPDLSDPSRYTWTKVKGEDGVVGTCIWITAEEETAGSQEGYFVFTKSQLAGDGPTNVSVDDIIFAGGYRYRVTNVGETYITVTDKEQLKGTDGVDGIDGTDGLDGTIIAVSSNEPTAGPNNTFIFNKTDFPAEYQNSIKVGDVVFAGDYRYVVQSIEGSVITCGQKEDLKGIDGQDGYSPTVSIVENNNREKVVTITDASGSHSTTIMDGATIWTTDREPLGPTTMGGKEYYTLSPVYLDGDGSTKWHTKDYVLSNGYYYYIDSYYEMNGEPVLRLTNKTKFEGEDGYSPTVTIDNTTPGQSVITITDKNGAHTTTIYDGAGGSGGKAYYGSVSTSANSSSKTVTILDEDFSLFEGMLVVLKFTNGNTATSMSININSTGNVNVTVNGSTDISGKLIIPADTTVTFAYDGTTFVYISSDNLLNEMNWSESGGLDIHAQSGSNSRVNITNDAVNIFDVNGNIGSRIDYSGMSIYKDSQRAAMFGSTTVIGNSEASRIILSDDSFSLIDNNNKDSFLIRNEEDGIDTSSLASPLTESTGDILPDRGVFKYKIKGIPETSATIDLELKVKLTNNRSETFTTSFTEGQMSEYIAGETVDIDDSYYESSIFYDGDRTFTYDILPGSSIKTMRATLTYVGTRVKYTPSIQIGLNSDEDLYLKISALGWTDVID